MPKSVHIDVAVGEQPNLGEKFVIALQENSEMLGLPDNGRTFRITSPTSSEGDYQKESRILTVVEFNCRPANGSELRSVGTMTYSA